ncbi:MAG: Asp-tRNA(Asn)/Glu-tRNA(Gln) amidotransferase subunit GatC [Lachnospiraceae bacterium]|nr:Asp-tRNA(Asn)/Glu-tRNA(Gln) amidotransferase subunit GatC [Lachnospiraceae bacterium]
MADKKIDDTIMNRIENLSKISLTDEERVKAMDEMEKLINYVDKISELNTDGVEPLVNVLPISNVLREDEVVINDDAVDRTIANGPAIKDNMFVVPKTV